MNSLGGFLLDTDILIYWLKNKYPVINQKIEQVGEEQLFVSTVSIAELYYGAYNSANPQHNCRLLDDFIENIQTVELNRDAAKVFGKIKADLKKSGQIIGDSDIFIAAIAIANDLTLVTNNEQHFRRIKALEVENWIK